jgi:putative ABC transport system ATP-binding protein
MADSIETVKLDNVHKVYYTGRIPVNAVNGISMSIYKGEFAVLMGPSGCGKSTLLHLIGAVDKPTSGAITVNGIPLTTLSDNQLSDFRRDKVGFVFQLYNLIPSLTAYENVEIPLSFRGMPAKERAARVTELLKLIGLEDRAEHTPSMLSGGEQQRVAIARAIANNPAIILLDEPTGDLDRTSGEAVMELLASLNKDHDKTYCMVTHDPEIAKYGSRILHMLDGKIVSEK